VPCRFSAHGIRYPRSPHRLVEVLTPLKSLRRFVSLSWHERRVLTEVVIRVLIARVAISTLPFRRIAPVLGRPRAVSRASPLPEQQHMIDTLAWATAAVERRFPRTCLAQAIAANAILKRHDIPRTVYLGMKKDTEGDWSAHAWLRCGGQILTGGPDTEGFAVVMTFTDDRWAAGSGRTLD